MTLVLLIGGGLVCLLLVLGVVAGIIVLVAVRESPTSAPQPAGPQVQGPWEQKPPRFYPSRAELFSFAEQSVRARRTRDVAPMFGNPQGDKVFRDIPPEGGVLIGFQAGLGKFIESPIVVSIRPIYLTKNGEKLGGWYGAIPPNPVTIKARPDYVVSSATIRKGLLVDAVSLRFTKLGPDRLLMDDSYASEWVGGNGGGLETIDNQGSIFVGIYGSLDGNNQLNGLGLVSALPP
jgi:hypothetical protein